MTWRYPTKRVGQLTDTTETFTLYDDGSPNYDERTLDLTDAESVTISLDHRNIAITPVTVGVCTITDAEAGEVEYTFSAAETSVYGEYFVQFEVTWSDGSAELVPPDGYESVMAIGRRQPHGPMPMTVSTLEASEVNVGDGGLTGLSAEAITWMTGAGLGVDGGELNVTAAFEGISGLTNPLTSDLNADNFRLRKVGVAQEPTDAARQGAVDANTESIQTNTTSIESNTTAIGENTTSISTLETDKADRAGDTIDPAVLNNARVIAPSVERAFDTLFDAHADLPAGGGTVLLAETCTETRDFTISKPTRIVGQGFPYSQNASAYINLNGNTVHVTSRGQTWEKLQMVGGNVIIGQHNVYGGRHHIELCVRESPTDSIEFRGGFLDCKFDIKSHQSAARGIVWNLDAGGVDYFNQNQVALLVHSATGDSVVMTGIGTGSSQVEGNDFHRFEVEAGTGTGLVIDNKIWLMSNEFRGYGIHDGGINVQPASARGNQMWFAVLRDGGTANLNGTLHTEESADLHAVSTSVGTEKRLTGTTRFMDTGSSPTRMERWAHDTYGDAEEHIQASHVGSSGINLGSIIRTATLEVHGEDSADNTISFVDQVQAIAYGSATVVASTTRGAPSSRNYTTNASGELLMSMSAGSYEVHVRKFVSKQK